jgi:hypothetical protein
MPTVAHLRCRDVVHSLMLPEEIVVFRELLEFAVCIQGIRLPLLNTVPPYSELDLPRVA